RRLRPTFPTRRSSDLGVSQTMLEAVRDAAMSSARAKLGGALLKPSLRGLRDQLDPEGPGGAYLLGLRQLGVVPHGRFTRFGWSRSEEHTSELQSLRHL